MYTLRNPISKPANLRASRFPLAIAGIMLVAVGGILTLQQLPKGPETAAPISAAAYKDSLKDQVDTAAGEPRSGRNPSTQKQTSLSEVASRENGSGSAEAPAAGLKDNSHVTVHPSDVLNNSQQTRVSVAGCLTDYGMQGQQCLPASSVVNNKLLCDAVKRQFPQGIMVMGTDRYNLDRNGDGTACGIGD